MGKFIPPLQRKLVIGQKVRIKKETARVSLRIGDVCVVEERVSMKDGDYYRVSHIDDASRWDMLPANYFAAVSSSQPLQYEDGPQDRA